MFEENLDEFEPEISVEIKRMMKETEEEEDYAQYAKKNRLLKKEFFRRKPLNLRSTKPLNDKSNKLK